MFNCLHLYTTQFSTSVLLTKNIAPRTPTISQWRQASEVAGSFSDDKPIGLLMDHPRSADVLFRGWDGVQLRGWFTTFVSGVLRGSFDGKGMANHGICDLTNLVNFQRHFFSLHTEISKMPRVVLGFRSFSSSAIVLRRFLVAVAYLGRADSAGSRWLISSDWSTLLWSLRLQGGLT
jgi:hypothetical protein